MGHFKGMGRKKVLAAKMLEQGLSSNTIAAELDIHERTVRRVKEKNYLDLPLISYIEEQERKENEKRFVIQVKAVEHSRIRGEIEIEAMDEAEAMMKAVMNKDQINWDYRRTGDIDRLEYMIIAEH